jgi:dipeptidase
VNERGFVIGNQAVFSNEIVERRLGLIVMNLLRLVVDRARNRNQSVDWIALRLEVYGQVWARCGADVAQDHNSFNIADPHGAVFMETADRHWIVRKVERDDLSNHIGTGTDGDKCSSGLESFARSEAYWEEEGPVHVEHALRQPQIPARLSDGGLRRSRELLAQLGNALDSADVQRLFRDHGDVNEVAPADASLEGGDFLLDASTTTRRDRPLQAGWPRFPKPHRDHGRYMGVVRGPVTARRY